MQLQDKSLILPTLWCSKNATLNLFPRGILEPNQGVHKTLEEKPGAEELVRTCCIKWGGKMRVVKQTKMVFGRKI